MYRCPSCESTNVRLFWDATAEYQQNEDGTTTYIDHETFDNLERIECANCGESDDEEPGSEWED
jgi:hypothetical protein